MDLSLKSLTVKTLDELNLKPKKKLGQNFLISKVVYKKIAESIIKNADLIHPEILVEIGPGLGYLIDELKNTNYKLIGIELDKKLAQFLKFKFSSEKVEIKNQDFLSFNLNSFDKVIVFGNIPYSISSLIIEKFCKSYKSIPYAIIMLQKEFGDRLIFQENLKFSSRLSVLVNLYFDVYKHSVISKEHFWPKPKVDSILIELKGKKSPPSKSIEYVTNVLKVCFSMKRKTIWNNLKYLDNSVYKEELINFFSSHMMLNRRAEEIELEIWKKLFSDTFI